MKIQTEKTLYIIGGANGSGKSTAESIFFGGAGLNFVNADNIAESDDLMPTSTNTGRALFAQFDKNYTKHASFVYETTLSGKDYNSRISRAKKEGYSVELLYVFLPSVEINLERVGNRSKKGGHNVKEEVVRRRYKRSLANFDDVCKKATSWRVYDNSDETQQCRLIATGTGDDVNVVDETLYKRFIDCKAQAIEQVRAERLERAAKYASK